MLRTGAKAIDTIDDVAEAAKAAKTGKMSDIAKTTGNPSGAIHGNSRMSTKSQHAYDIIDTETGKVVKTGVSGGSVRRDGKSYRAEQQVRKRNEAENTPTYESVITHIEPEGVGVRDRILEYERQRSRYLRQNDQLDNTKHIRP